MSTFQPAPREPSHLLSDPYELACSYLDFYRSTLLRKLNGLSAAEMRTSRLPSEWTPVELVKHLTYVEHRWLCWGFTAEQVAEPWGDEDPWSGRWHVGADEPVEQVLARYVEQCERSREIVAGAGLADRSRIGGRFATADEAPTLGWILLHLLQEYARHVGHLDVARELADGNVGE